MLRTRLLCVSFFVAHFICLCCLYCCAFDIMPVLFMQYILSMEAHFLYVFFGVKIVYSVNRLCCSLRRSVTC